MTTHNYDNPEYSELALRVAEMEKNIESIVAMLGDLYETVHRVERVLLDEETLDHIPHPVDERGPDGLFAEVRDFVQSEGVCSVSLIQKTFRINYRRTFALLEALEEEGIIAPYRGEALRVVNQ